MPTVKKKQKSSSAAYATNYDDAVNILQQNYARLALEGKGEDYLTKVRATIQEILLVTQK